MELVDGKLAVFFRNDTHSDGSVSYHWIDDPRADSWKALGPGNYDMDRVLVRLMIGPRPGDTIPIDLGLSDA